MEGREMIEICFLGGECRDAMKGSCNYMLGTVTDDEDEKIELYAEMPVSESPFDDDGEDFDFDDFDDYSYPVLKAEITRQAIENGIDPERLKFWWG